MGKTIGKMRAGRVAGAALAAFAVGAPLAAAGVNAVQHGSHVGEIGSAYAEKKPDEIPVAASNEFYAYVKAGEQLWIKPDGSVRGVTACGRSRTNPSLTCPAGFTTPLIRVARIGK